MDAVYSRKPEERDKRNRRIAFERDLLIAESDGNKLLSQKQGYELELRQIKRQEELLRQKRQEREEGLKRLENDIRLNQEEIRRLKKEII